MEKSMFKFTENFVKNITKNKDKGYILVRFSIPDT